MGTLLGALLVSICFTGAEKILYGQVILKTGKVLEADVALELEDCYILRAADGLRVLSRAAVERVVPVSRSSGGDPGLLSPPESAKKGRLWPGGPKPKESSRSHKGVEGPGSPKNPGAPGVPDGKISVKVLPEDRLDAARSAGRVPVLKISLAGTIDGKTLDPADPFTISRMTYFFANDSRPRFKVIEPELPASNQGSGKEEERNPPAEYLALLTTETGMKTLSFYETKVLEKFESKVLFQLVRASDKKVVVEVQGREDIGGDPDHREEFCRQAYEKSVEALLERLGTLKPFGGSSSGS